MSANAGRIVIPDSDSDGEPYYYSDIYGKPYYYSDILSQGSGLQRASLLTNRWENLVWSLQGLRRRPGAAARSKPRREQWAQCSGKMQSLGISLGL